MLILLLILFPPRIKLDIPKIKLIEAPSVTDKRGPIIDRTPHLVKLVDYPNVKYTNKK